MFASFGTRRAKRRVHGVCAENAETRTENQETVTTKKEKVKTRTLGKTAKGAAPNSCQRFTTVPPGPAPWICKGAAPGWNIPVDPYIQSLVC